ncbi:MAG: YkgJ family cysteine cluster protein [Betaproteobacteria bacterium]|nr:YkgJ family cysteine cluster protein [Betaproteobacteria bacterium]
MNAEDDCVDTDEGPAVSCATCKACCCRLEVLLMGEDDIPAELTLQDPWGGWVMRRLDDGWCAALDRSTMLCTIYERRPVICRDFRTGESECIEERLQLVASPSRVRAGLVVPP